MNSPKPKNSAKFETITGLGLLASGALALWALCIFLGTGLGYDHPVFWLFDGGFLASLWRFSKTAFVGSMAWAVLHMWLEHIGEAS